MACLLRDPPYRRSQQDDRDEFLVYYFRRHEETPRLSLSFDKTVRLRW